MSSNVIYPLGGGGVEITVPATESIAVYTKDVAKVYRKVGYPNQPDSLELLGTVSNGETVFGAYASGATIVINAEAAEVLYQVGSAPVVLERRNLQEQGNVSAQGGATTLTVANLLTGIITGTQSTGGNVNYTLPTGALTDAGAEFAIGDSFDWSLINLSSAAADTVTVTAGTGHTIVGVAVVQSAHATTGGLYGNAARFRTRKTAADTFITYRIS